MKDTFSKEYRIVAEKDENALFAANFLKDEIFSKSGIHENPETEEKIIYLKTDASLQPENFL